MSNLSAAQVHAIFGEAVVFHQRGRLDQAKSNYEFILERQPRHYPSLHLLGVLAAQTKNYQLAVELIGRAIELNPNDPNFYINRGNAFKELNQLEAAAANYETAISLKPDNAQAYANLGVVSQLQGKMDDAVAHYEKAISLNPGNAEAYSNRGRALKDINQLEAALASCEQAISIRPNYAEAHFNRGLVLLALRRLEDAKESYDKAIYFHPQFVEANLHCGIVLQELSQMETAIAYYDRVLTLVPMHVEANFNKGVALNCLGDPLGAIACYDQAIAAKADFPQAHANRGVALQAIRQWEAAIVDFERAIALQPAYVDAYVNRGVSLHVLRRFKAAIASYDLALQIKPDYSNAHANRGVALHAQKKLDEALACYDRAIQCQHDNPEAHFFKSQILLLRGDLVKGWDLYQWLWRTAKAIPKLRHFDKPVWGGEQTLSGKTILVYSEQGLGDMIQFCRYVRLLANAGARVVLEVPATLQNLLRNLDGVCELVVQGDVLPPFDYQCLLLSLPKAFNTGLNNIPQSNAYLHSDPLKVAQWKERLGEKARLRLGIAWSGSLDHSDDHNRSLGLSMLKAALPDGIEYVSLQKEVRSSDLPALVASNNIRHFGNEIADFSDTAALCELVDVVISVDTSVAHLSGALGRPTWLMLPFVPDWRWLMDRTDSPWYGSVKLYRQSTQGDWNSVLTRINADLSQWQQTQCLQTTAAV